MLDKQENVMPLTLLTDAAVEYVANVLACNGCFFGDKTV